MKGDFGAFNDLAEGSCALNAIPATQGVPAHALGGTGGSDLVTAAGVVGTIANLGESCRPCHRSSV